MPEASISVAFHAAARELAGTRSAQIPTAEPMSLTELRRELGTRFKSLAPFLVRMRVAKNGEFASETDTVQAGDSVDILPPVAGGR